MDTAAILEKVYKKRMLIKKIRPSEKNEKAWEKLEKIGEAVSAKWKSKIPSWKIISQSRR